MATAPRYEKVDIIASGDFATVYRARDRALGREVAIKEIHQQFLHDERQLARYWQEAQLLASLQHPNILTIYDLDRTRGWLILELMRGSLKQAAQGDPIDLDFLRLALSCALNGLQFLHSNGVIHGDVKPSNLLLDAQQRIKLGDFGLARRAASEEGSLLKGTTKYMAPELVAAQFGAVGPASDLYSLGFSAYELMCGAQFEALFPTLGAFGRDKQIAWMMWHAAPDRTLPEIGRVLQGVPDDLTRVIQRLVAKDQAVRYRSAAEALRDLRTDRLAVPGDEPPAPVDDAAAIRRRRLILGGSGALGCVLLVLLALFLTKKPPPPPKGPPVPDRGLVRALYPDEHKFVLEASETGKPKEVTLERNDEIFVNGKAELLASLQMGDHVLVKILFDELHRPHRQVFASRPEANQGTVAEVVSEQGILRVKIADAVGKTRELAVSVPNDLKIQFNGKTELDKKPVKLADLRPGDRVVVHHIGDEMGGDTKQRTATELSAQRVVTAEGVVRSVDPAKREFTFSVEKLAAPGKAPPAATAETSPTAADASDELVTMPFADPCEVTVNGMRFLDQQVLKPTDLKPGDKVRVSHDVAAVRVDAYRILGQAGVIQKAEYNLRLLEVTLEGKPEPVSVLVPATCQITLGGEPAQMDDLRVGDQVDISHDNAGEKTPSAKTLTARRPPDPTRWALLIGNQDFEDLTVTKPPYATADVKAFREVLVHRYKVPEEQILLLTDESLVRLQQGIPPFLERVPAEAKLLVYVTGEGYKGTDDKVYLAPKNFMLTQMATSGLPLQWLLDQLEQCKAGAKLFVLDAAGSGDGPDLKLQPSTAEMIGTIQGPPGMAALRTVTAVASCKAGEHGEVLKDQGHGLFGACLAEGYNGAADKNRDTIIEPTELFDYLTSAMAAAGSKIQKTQTPQLFLPDARPPRLTEEAKKGIRKLISMLRQDRIDLTAAKAACLEVEPLAEKEVEPKLLRGLLLMKSRQRDAREDAFHCFEEISVDHPEELIPAQAMAWIQFEKLAAQAGVERLADLAGRIPVPKDPKEPLPANVQRLLVWMGQLREFAAKAAVEGRRASSSVLANLDSVVEQRGAEAVRLYEEGRAKTSAIAADYDAKIAAAEERDVSARLKVERYQLVHYAVFPYDDVMQEILARLEH